MIFKERVNGPCHPPSAFLLDYLLRTVICGGSPAALADGLWLRATVSLAGSN